MSTTWWGNNEAANEVKLDGPHFQHDGEISLVPCVDKDHYLGSQMDNAGEPIDLYIHVSERTGESELIARFGDELDDCIEDSLPRIFSLGAQWANVMAGVDRSYGIRMAFEAAEKAGYDLAQVAKDSPAYGSEDLEVV